MNLRLEITQCDQFSRILQESLAEIDSTSSIDYQLILIVGLAFLLVILGIYTRSSPANLSTEKKNEDNLDEEYEEIGDPYETRLNQQLCILK